MTCAAADSAPAAATGHASVPWRIQGSTQRVGFGTVVGRCFTPVVTGKGPGDHRLVAATHTHTNSSQGTLQKDSMEQDMLQEESMKVVGGEGGA